MPISYIKHITKYAFLVFILQIIILIIPTYFIMPISMIFALSKATFHLGLLIVLATIIIGGFSFIFYQQATHAPKKPFLIGLVVLLPNLLIAYFISLQITLFKSAIFFALYLIPTSIAATLKKRKPIYTADPLTLKNIAMSCAIVISILIGLNVSLFFVSHYRSNTKNAFILYDYGYFHEAYEKAMAGAYENDPSAKYLVAKMFLSGIGISQDAEQGFKWLEDAAMQGNVDAQYLLGEIYHFGEFNIIKDIKKSALWYQKAVDGGSILAANNLAILYNHGEGVEKNPAKARALYELAAAKGDEYAMYNIGFNYTKNVPVDYKRAAEWFQKSIQTNPGSCALNDLGMLYATGKGVSRDLKKSEKLLQEAGKKLLLEENDLFDEFLKENVAFTHLSHAKQKAKLDEIISAFSEYQMAKALNKNNDAALEKKYPSDTMKTAKYMSNKIVTRCWD